MFLLMPVCSNLRLLYCTVVAANNKEKETKGKTLEELDQVFSMSTRDHAKHAAKHIPYGFNKYVMRKSVQPANLFDAGVDGVTAGVVGEMDVV